MVQVDAGSPEISPAGRASVGILLAAGYGRRFAAVSVGDKLFAELPGGQAVAVASARALRAAVDRVVAVVRPESEALKMLLRAEGCEVLAAAQARQGMGASLAAAAAHWLDRAATGQEPVARVVVALADMPWIRPDTYGRVLSAAGSAAIVAPVYQGERGHPVVFEARLLPELAALRGDSGAKALVGRHGLTLVGTDDAGVLRDVDTPQDLPTR
ncbi:MAG: nucleotidyltransferase family protein [Pigmentiphaga sp.]